MPSCIFAATVLATLPVRTAYQGESFFALSVAVGGNELPEKPVLKTIMAELVEAQVIRYQEYKPMGVEWMQEIPVGWEVRKLKYVADINVNTLPETTNDTYSFRYLDIGNVTLGSIDYNVEPITFKEAPSRARRIIGKGDILVSTVRTYLKAIAQVEEDTTNLIVSTGFAVVSARQGLDKRFLLYVSVSENFVDTISAYSTGVSYPAITATELGNMPVWFPVSLEEQRLIARFLDDKTAQIDQLITQKQQMLMLLREERAALINHVMTKGLDAAAPLRDSGVEWLGEVPAHWEVKKLKWIAEIQGGIALSAGKKLENPIMRPYLRVANVQDGYLDLAEVKTVEVEAEQVGRYALHKGDLLMNEGGDNDKLGRGCVWQGEIEPCLHQNHVFAVRLFNGYNPEWLNLITVTEGARTHFMTRAKQSTNLASISSSNIKELSVLLPPVAEQQEIMALVAEETARVAEVTATINQEIGLLQEYRAALIAEAVTGQLDVRNYVPAQVPVLM